jgi:hypothetical protein
MARHHDHHQDGPGTVRVPAEVEKPDPILFGLTARQAAMAASVLGGLWGLWQATRTWVPAPIFLIVAVPIATAVITVLTVRRGGRPLEDVLVDAWRHHRAPKRLVPSDGPPDQGPAPVPEWIDLDPGPLPAPLRLPATAINEAGIVDLGGDGLARPLACSTVNFGLRTPAEQRVLLAGFARWLHSLSSPVQIVARAEPLDLTPITRHLTAQAGSLPHPALETACHAHAEFLDHLARTQRPLRRRVTVVLTATGGDQAGELGHRAEDTARTLAGCDLTVTPLSAARTAGLLRAAADPGRTRTPAVGTAADVIHGEATLLQPPPDTPPRTAPAVPCADAERS